jgi:hypothetical protein
VQANLVANFTVPGHNAAMNFTAGSLFASVIWGAIGLGLFVYGKKQQAIVPLLGGLVLMAMTYLVSSALTMSLAGIAVLAGIYIFEKRQN